MLPKSSTLKALIACAALALVALLSAEPIKQLKPTGYVDDFAHVLDPASKSAIEQLATQIDQKTGAQIAVVTIRSLDGQDIESYAAELYKQWGIGPRSSNRGVLILLAVDDHRYRTEVGYGLEPILPDGKVGAFGREAVPFLRQNNYGAALRLMTQRVAQTIADDAHVTLTGVEAATPRPPPSDEDGFPGWLVLLIIVAAVWIFSRVVGAIMRGGGGGRRGGRGGWGVGPGIFWSGLGGYGGGGGWSSGGSWGGGGGFGGGSGFGGFGGGISGGGGASGSW